MPASPVLSSICFLTYAIPRQVSGLLLSVYRLTFFGYFLNCTVAYWLTLNSTTVCFVCKRSTQRCGQVLTTAVDRMQVFGQHHPEPIRAILLAIARVALWRPRRFATSRAQRLKGSVLSFASAVRNTSRAPSQAQSCETRRWCYAPV